MKNSKIAINKQRFIYIGMFIGVCVIIVCFYRKNEFSKEKAVIYEEESNKFSRPKDLNRNQDDIIEIFDSNKDLFNKIADEFYQNEKKIRIDFVEGKPTGYYFGTNIEDKEELYEDLVELYSLTECFYVRMYFDDDGNKILSIWMPGMEYVEFDLIFREDNNEYYYYNLDENWYLEIIGYT